MNFALAAMCLLFVIFVVIVPITRLKLRTGKFGVVIRDKASEVENIVRIATSLMFLGLIAMAGVVTVVGLESLGPFLPPTKTWIAGVALGSSGILIIVIAQAQMGASWRIGIDDEFTSLCTRGLYRYVRHPIYSGIAMCLIGVIFLAPTAWTLVLAIPGFLLIMLQARMEESHMLDLHGDEFLSWALKTGRVIPGIGVFKNEEQARIALGR